MKKVLLVTLALCLAACVDALAQNRAYFISPSGDDSNSGLSIANPWRSLDKVNQHEFQPGDVIHFETGGTWHGQLRPRGSGAEGNPITLQSYGHGEMPVINMGDAEGSAIRLVNQSWWEIRGLAVTSGAQPTLGIGRQGIAAIATGPGNQIEHIVIEDNYIHDIWGQLDGRTIYTGYNSAAIYVGRAFRDPNSDSTNLANDVLIQNNRIERVDKAGIVVFRGVENINVRGNNLKNLGGDGIFVNGANMGMIEDNVVRRYCLRSGDPDLEGSEDFWPHTAAIWIQNAYRTVMQYNEVYDTGRQPGNGDGFAYDFDFDCKECVLQYNYSKNNHGLVLIMHRVTDSVVRYNISHNDQTHLVQIHGTIDEGNVIHNNLFYVDDRSKPFSNNLYFGPWLNGLPDDAEKIVADPMFLAPGTGGDGFSSLKGYILKRDSPAINAGTADLPELPWRVTKDFFGNPVYDGAPDIGVYEQVGSMEVE